MRSSVERGLAGGVALTVLALVGAGPAMAAVASRPGSTAESTASRVYSRDTADDGRFVSTVYIPGGGGNEKSIVNQSGPFTQAYRTEAGVINVKACISRPALPMACTAWNAHL